MTVLVQVAPVVIVAAYILVCFRWQPGARGHLAFAGVTLAVDAAALAAEVEQDIVLTALFVVFLVIAGINYGRDEGATREHLETTAGIAVAAFDLDVLSKPTAVLIPETVDGPFTGRVYRALPDFVAQVEGHPRGLIVFLDDAERILNDAQVDAYAAGRKDQFDEDQGEDPEQADALNEVTDKPVLSDEARARLASPDTPRMTIDDADVLPMDRPACDSGVSAFWCARCGTCTCSRPDNGWANSLDDPACPLHGANSDHATEEPTRG
jgi:hypothetical protein